MINTDLQHWIQRQNKVLEVCFGGTQTDKEKLYARVIKLKKTNQQRTVLCKDPS